MNTLRSPSCLNEFVRDQQWNQRNEPGNNDAQRRLDQSIIGVIPRRFTVVKDDDRANVARDLCATSSTYSLRDKHGAENSQTNRPCRRRQKQACQCAEQRTNDGRNKSPQSEAPALERRQVRYDNGGKQREDRKVKLQCLRDCRRNCCGEGCSQRKLCFFKIGKRNIVHASCPAEEQSGEHSLWFACALPKAYGHASELPLVLFRRRPSLDLRQGMRLIAAWLRQGRLSAQILNDVDRHQGGRWIDFVILKEAIFERKLQMAGKFSLSLIWLAYDGGDWFFNAGRLARQIGCSNVA